VDDGVLDRGETPPLPWIAALAHLKARAGLERAAHALPRLPDAWVLGADTVVVKDGDVIGQPRDADEARAITHRLRRGEHRVVTAVALARLHRDEARATRDARPRVRWLIDTARVRVGDIPDTEIDAYIAGGGWSGKAGAYNFAERQSAGWPIECRDDPTTVMGLPMRRLTPLLRALVNGKSSGDNA
jgi:septum formation protein